MKKHILILFVFLRIVFSLSAQESLICNQGSLMISEETCALDSLRFTVTVMGSFELCGAFASGFPEGSTVAYEGGQASIIDGTNTGLIGTTSFVIPTCDEVTISFIAFDFTGVQCDECGSLEVPFGGGAAIPTMGQWALVSLGLLLFIFGLVKLRSEFIAPSLRI